MDEEGIGLVWARAIELRLKFSNCIQKSASSQKPKEGGEREEENGEVNETEDEEEGSDETERLLSIFDALEGLESQLSSLQDMLQNHQYESESALVEIEFSRKVLLDKLKKYQGEDMEVIQEATAFAGEALVHNNDLLLPPYPCRPRFSLKNGYLSTSLQKSLQNGVLSSEHTNGGRKNLTDPESNHNQKSKGLRLRSFFGSVAKATIAVVGVMSVLSLTGFRPKQSEGSVPFKFLDMLLQSNGNERESGIHCPPGKVLVVEDGKARCLVRERVEVPFESVVTSPNVNYGCG